MNAPIDGSLYPDVDPPAALETPELKAEHVHRVCGALDFGIVPEMETLELLSGWKEVFDRHPLRASPAYHALREHFGWEPVERLPYLGTPLYLRMDRLEGREDGFEDRV